MLAWIHANGLATGANLHDAEGVHANTGCDGVAFQNVDRDPRGPRVSENRPATFDGNADRTNRREVRVGGARQPVASAHWEVNGHVDLIESRAGYPRIAGAPGRDGQAGGWPATGDKPPPYSTRVIG